MNNFGNQKPPPGNLPDPSWVQDTGCVLFLPFNEYGGNKVYDLSGNRNDGILINMSFPPTAVSGWSGEGIALDGTNDYIVSSNNIILNDFTVIVWVYRTLTGTKYFWSFGYNNPNSLIVYTEGTNSIKIYSPAFAAIYDTGLLFTFNTWHFIAITRAGNTITCYYDSVKALNSDASYVFTINRKFELGWAVTRNNAIAYLGGYFRHAFVFNKALPESEIKRQYSEPYYMIPKHVAKRMRYPVIYTETNKEQIILAETSELDNVILNELNKSQTILSVQTEIDNILVNELSKEQVILAEVSEIDTMIMQEILKEQIIQVIQSETDNLILNETNKEQIILVPLSEMDSMVADETNKEQVCVVVVEEEDHAVFNELLKSQLILAIIEQTNYAIFYQPALEQIILVITDGVGYEDVAQYTLARVATQGRYGPAHVRYVPVTTQGRYDKLISSNPIIITLKLPSVQLAMDVPEININVKVPEIKLALK